MAETRENNYSFPDDFILGCASASYQVEGAWNEDGKGESMWDHYTHKYPELVKDGSNGDVACDSYHKYKEDVKLIKNIDFKFYRFSLSWTRILPTGEETNVNEAGIVYYRNLIKELLANDITPMVTLYHWDLPQALAALGGWVNPIMADYFEKYSRVVFRRLGDLVKMWITINEPSQIVSGYGDKMYVPVLDYHGVGEYLAAHNLLRAHGKVYHLYNDEFRSSQNGKIGITNFGRGAFPKSDCDVDKEAAQTMMEFELGWFAHPVFSETGDYPISMRNKIDANSKREGRTSSRLPRFTESEVASIKGSADFFGLNHYTSRLVTPGASGRVPSWEHDTGVLALVDPSWTGSSSRWLKVVPSGFRSILNWIKKEYKNPVVIVTENGFSDNRDTLEDDDRIKYYKSYLTELLNARYEDGCNVHGYFAWSLMDNFEWLEGYTERFGLYYVDFKDENRPRKPKKSVEFFKRLLIANQIPQDF